jgi:hypothetical protein
LKSIKGEAGAGNWKGNRENLEKEKRDGGGQN